MMFSSAREIVYAGYMVSLSVTGAIGASIISAGGLQFNTAVLTLYVELIKLSIAAVCVFREKY